MREDAEIRTGRLLQPYGRTLILSEEICIRAAGRPRILWVSFAFKPVRNECMNPSGRYPGKNLTLGRNTLELTLIGEETTPACISDFWSILYLAA